MISKISDEGENRYRRIYENISAGIARVSLDSRIESANSAYCRMLGYTEEELIGKQLRDITHPDSTDENMEKQLQLKKGELNHYRMKMKFIHKDGHTVYGILDANLIRGDDGKPGYFVGTVVDITEQKKAEQRYRDVVENAHDAIYTIHPNTGFQYVNPAFEELTGYSADEICSKNFNFLEIIHPEDVELIEDRAGARKREEELTEKYEFKLVARDGSIKTVAATTVPLPARNKTVIGILRNITGEKSRTKLLEAFNQSAMEIEKALTPETMFDSVSGQLKDLGYDSVIYFPNNRGGLTPGHLSFESRILKGIEKISGLTLESYTIPLDKSTPHGKVVHNRDTYFIANVIEGFNSLLPEPYRKFADNIASLLHLPEKEIAAPIIVEDEVIGVFSILSNDLTPDDKATVTAFSRLLGAGFHKTRLFAKNQKEITKRIETQRELQSSKEDLKQSFIELAETTARVLGVRDVYTEKHEQGVARLARQVGQRMGLTEDRQLGLYLGGILHDIGKIAIPETILTKPGELKEVEWELIRSHPEVGYEKILGDTNFPWPVADMTLHHHERLDGSGYPEGLGREEISKEAKILGAVDVVEAMSSMRPYRGPRTKEEVLTEISSGREEKYDKEVVDIIVDMIEEGKINFDD